MVVSINYNNCHLYWHYPDCLKSNNNNCQLSNSDASQLVSQPFNTIFVVITLADMGTHTYNWHCLGCILLYWGLECVRMCVCVSVCVCVQLSSTQNRTSSLVIFAPFYLSLIFSFNGNPLHAIHSQQQQEQQHQQPHHSNNANNWKLSSLFPFARTVQ